MNWLAIGFIVLVGLLAFGVLALLFCIAHYFVTYGFIEGWMEDENDEPISNS